MVMTLVGSVKYSTSSRHIWFRVPKLESHGYSVGVGTLEWIVDRYTIVEQVTNREADEAQLPSPMKLNTLPFSNIEHQLPGAEFDLPAMVENCSAMQYTADQTKRYREAIVMDRNKKPFMFTMWDDLADNEGVALLEQQYDHPVILAKRVAGTKYRRVLRLTTRYSSTIFINPLYVQVAELIIGQKRTNECF